MFIDWLNQLNALGLCDLDPLEIGSASISMIDLYCALFYCVCLWIGALMFRDLVKVLHGALLG